MLKRRPPPSSVQPQPPPHRPASYSINGRRYRSKQQRTNSSSQNQRLSAQQASEGLKLPAIAGKSGVMSLKGAPARPGRFQSTRSSCASGASTAARSSSGESRSTAAGRDSPYLPHPPKGPRPTSRLLHAPHPPKYPKPISRFVHPPRQQQQRPLSKSHGKSAPVLQLPLAQLAPHPPRPAFDASTTPAWQKHPAFRSVHKGVHSALPLQLPHLPVHMPHERPSHAANPQSHDRSVLTVWRSECICMKCCLACKGVRDQYGSTGAILSVSALLPLLFFTLGTSPNKNDAHTVLNLIALKNSSNFVEASWDPIRPQHCGRRFGDPARRPYGRHFKERHKTLLLSHHSNSPVPDKLPRILTRPQSNVNSSSIVLQGAHARHANGVSPRLSANAVGIRQLRFVHQPTRMRSLSSPTDEGRRSQEASLAPWARISPALPPLILAQ